MTCERCGGPVDGRSLLGDNCRAYVDGQDDDGEAVPLPLRAELRRLVTQIGA